VRDVEVLFYFGGAPEVERRGSDVLLPVADDLAHVARKTVAFFDFALDFVDFDLLFRTNCSSYVDLPNLRAFADRHAHAARYYAGFTGRHEGMLFAAGSGYFLSRDLVRTAAADWLQWNERLLDDVALADVLHRHGVAPVPIPRRDYTAPGHVTPADASLFHFRCKTESRFRHEDVRIMLAVHRMFLRSRGGRLPWALRGQSAIATLAKPILAFAVAARRLARRYGRRY
jgi:hypothetical protein